MNGWQMLPNEEGTTTRLWYERIEPDVTKWQLQLPVYRTWRRGDEDATRLHRYDQQSLGNWKTNDLVSLTDCKGKSTDEGETTDEKKFKEAHELSSNEGTLFES